MKNRFTIRLVSFGLLAMILIAGCATFEGELPVELDIPDTTYISPANQDGIQDELTITVELTLPIPNVVVERFRITIADAERAAVIVLEETMDKATLRKLPRAERKKVKFSEYVVWDGTDDLGEYVPDGEYIYWIETWDKQDNKGQSPFYYVVVDNTSPDIELSLPYPVFSPNGDGRLDLLTINQRNSSSEEQWSGEIRDADQAKIKSFSWEG